MAYFLHTNLLFVFLFLVYLLFLKQSQLLHFRRFYLLTALVVALIAPMLSSYIPFLETETIAGHISLDKIAAQINNIEHETLEMGNLKVNDTKVIYFWYLGYFTISTFFLLNYCRNLYGILRLTKAKSTIVNGMQTVLIREKSNPFSFFNYLFINENDIDKLVNNQAIITHEKAHATQKHSLDLLLIGLLKAIFWCNPILIAYKKAMQDNHEYLADDYASKQLSNSNEYLLEIMSYLRSKKNPNPLSSHFAHHIIKKRIQMIQQKKPTTMKKISTISLSIATTLVLLCVFSFGLKETEIPIAIEAELNSTSKHQPSILPMDKAAITKISSAFGMRHNPFSKSTQMHTGIDIVAPEGTAIVATADGKISYAGFSEGYGNHIKIQHGEQFTSMYAHLEKMEVKAGALVKKGDRIGLIGTTGKSVKTHLHYEIEKDNEKVDPALYFQYEMTRK